MTESRKLYLVFRLLASTIADKELMEFFNLLKKISFGYILHLKKNKGYKIAERDERIEDLAHGFLVNLFRRDDSGKFVVWHRYVETQGNPNESTIDSFLRKIVIKKTKQELTFYYQHKDSVGSNIRRMITRFGGDWFKEIYTKQGRALVHVDDMGKPVVPLEYDEANKLFENFSHERSRSKSIARMLDSIPANGHARSILVSDAISIIRSRIRGEDKKICVDKEGSAFDVVVHHDSDDFLLRDIAFKFIDSYCQNPNNNTPWAAHDYWPYAPVAKDCISAYIQGAKDSFYDCAKIHFPEMSQKEYRGGPRFRIEYLLRMTAKHLRSHVNQK